tara:strand:+ start:2685 stop:2975 length:291 start_codon:yes stop_codon:yes gene_type:complete
MGQWNNPVSDFGVVPSQLKGGGTLLIGLLAIAGIILTIVILMFIRSGTRDRDRMSLLATMKDDDDEQTTNVNIGGGGNGSTSADSDETFVGGGLDQ